MEPPDKHEFLLKGARVTLPEQVHLQHLFEDLIVTNNNMTPTAQETALWSEHGESITFAELNQRANLVARILRLILTTHGQCRPCNPSMPELHGKSSSTSSNPPPTTPHTDSGTMPALPSNHQAPVCVFMSADIDRIVVLLACLKLGVPYLPLDREYPHCKRQNAVKMTKPLCVVMSQEYFATMVDREERLEDNVDSCPYFVYEELLELGIQRCKKSENLLPTEMLCSHSDPQALQILTSGSSGATRMVQISHRNLYNRLLWQWQEIAFSEYDICCQKTSCLFIDAHTELWLALLRGIPSVIISPETFRDLCAFTNVIRERFITRVTLVPSYLHNWLDMLQLYGREWVDKLLSLEMVICSGEPLLVDLAMQFFAVFPRGKRLVNLYGSTEVTGDVTGQIFTCAEDVVKYQFHRCMSVGTPCFNTDILLLRLTENSPEPANTQIDTESNVCNVFVSGANVARHQPHNPADFLLHPNPSSQEPEHGRMLRMSDVGIVNEGRLYIVGRCSSDVKIMGCRINTMEIDSVVRSATGVRECHTVCLPAEPTISTKPLLVTFYCLKPGVQVTPKSIMEHCAQNLPTYVTLTLCHIHELPHLPSSGKLDIHRLRSFYLSMVKSNMRLKPRQSESGVSRWLSGMTSGRNSPQQRKKNESADSSFLSPQRRNEILQIFATHLKIPLANLNLELSFHEIGGDSLRAALIVNSLQKAGFHISLQSFSAVERIGSLVTMLEHDMTVLEPLRSMESPASVAPWPKEREDKFVVSDMTSADEEVIYFLTDLFIRKDPYCLRMRCAYEDVAHVIHEFFVESFKINCSTVVRRKSVSANRASESGGSSSEGSLVGVCIVTPSEPFEAPSHVCPFGSFDEDELEEEVFSVCSGSTSSSSQILTNSINTFDRLHSFLHFCETRVNTEAVSPAKSSVNVVCLAVSDQLHVKSALWVIRKMEGHSLRKAKQMGFTHVKTVNTSFVTKEICRELGYSIINESSLSEFLSEMQEPILPQDKDLIAYFAIKDLSQLPLPDEPVDT